MLEDTECAVNTCSNRPPKSQIDARRTNVIFSIRGMDDLFKTCRPAEAHWRQAETSAGERLATGTPPNRSTPPASFWFCPDSEHGSSEMRSVPPLWGESTGRRSFPLGKRMCPGCDASSTFFMGVAEFLTRRAPSAPLCYEVLATIVGRNLLSSQPCPVLRLSVSSRI